MKTMSMLCLLFIVIGCTHRIDIRSAEALKIDDDYILLQLVTSENLVDLKDSAWCYEPIVAYSVNTIKRTDGLLPFSIKGWIPSRNIGEAGYESKWKIPAKDTIIIGGETYTYDYSDKKLTTLFVKIHGATMGGGHLESNLIKVQLME